MVRRKKDLPDPEELLSGRVTATVRDLFDLIHWINPSGKGLSAGGKGKAYAMKAALQSLLIENYQGELMVEAMSGSGGEVIGIRHRFLPLNACHAVVLDLSPKARQWVQVQLESWTTEKPTPVSGSEEKDRLRESLKKLLEKGDQALAQFDFPLAGEFYEKALRRSKAWREESFFLEAAKRFLVLMVDHWVDDERVLEFLQELPEPLACHAELYPLFAISLARLGILPHPDPGAALHWIRSRRGG